MTAFETGVRAEAADALDALCGPGAHEVVIDYTDELDNEWIYEPDPEGGDDE